MTRDRAAASAHADLAELTLACEDAQRALSRALAAARGASPEDSSAALAALEEALHAVGRAREAIARAEGAGGGTP